ncbi:MAG: hypothetical protein VKK04_13495 [Synechococcales bacterium]|nr:hypothetical protein [Synechococcales bacterium]
MGRPKRGSRVLSRAERRAAALRSLGTELDLGHELTLAAYNQLIQQLREQIALYNESLSYTDRAANAVEETEKQLRLLSERMLIGVAAKYGKDSDEYEMAGGTRKSEYKKRSQPSETMA